jgi:phage protein D
MRVQKKTIRSAVATTLITALLSVAVLADGGRLQAVIGGQTLSLGNVDSIEVDCSLGFLPIPVVCIAAVTLLGNKASEKLPPAGSALGVDATADDGTASIFKGEIVSVEPAFDSMGNATVVIRAFNRLHRLTRGRKSRTFEKMTDADVAARIATENGLSFGPTGLEARVGYIHFEQNNQTDLEFLLDRAQRIGYDVFVDDSTLYFQRRRDPPPLPLDCAPGRAPGTLLKVFHPLISSANRVSKVTLRGWDPQKQEEITATATQPVIPLSPAGREVTNPQGPLVDLGFVRSLETPGAAYGALLGTLTTLTAGDLSGEVDADGHAALRAGARVSLEGVDQAFNGEYQIARVTHRFGPDSNEGWHTLMRVVRVDRGVFLLPEIGDNVLVTFEHGDLAHPIVVGSLWDDSERPPEEAPICKPWSGRP